jgi:uncharacterized membrane protein
LILNILVLMAIAIIPFPNAVVAEYLTDPGMRSVAAFVYGLAMFVLAVMFNVVWWYAYKRGLLRTDVDRAKVLKVLRSYGFGPVVFLLGMALSGWAPEAVLVVFVLLPLGYLFEGLSPRSTKLPGRNHLGAPMDQLPRGTARRMPGC